MTPERRQGILKNIFPGAHAALPDGFAFHTHADNPRSSQAIAVDLFGTIQQVEADRDLILNRLADSLGLPSGGEWELHLEWKDPRNRLAEPRPSQVDAVAFGEHTTIFFECKFTEPDGGHCSQPKEGHCNGAYIPQHNKVDPIASRCALAAKGIKYWDEIPRLFHYDAIQNYRPCPFAGPWYQWMRNIVLCRQVAEERGTAAAFVIVYADKAGLPISDRLQSQAWWDELRWRMRPGLIQVRTLSYQQAVATARAATRHDRPLFDKLEQHLLDKIARA